MRHLVYLLLLANLAYLGWNLFQVRSGSEQVRELPPLPATAKRLVTLQELQQQGQQKVQEQERQLQQQQRQAQTRAQAEEEQLQMPREQEQTVLEEPGALEDNGDQADQDELAEEQMQEDLFAIEAVTEAEPPGAGVSMLCQSLGPFLATEQLEQVAERLADLGLESTRRSAETRLENGWWVYLPAMPRPEALEIVDMLEENNDREYFIGKGNYISLGTFNELSRAERRMQNIRRLGLEPIMETRYQTQTAHWIDLRVTGVLDRDLGWITEDYPGLQLESQSCR